MISNKNKIPSHREIEVYKCFGWDYEIGTNIKVIEPQYINSMYIINFSRIDVPSTTHYVIDVTNVPVEAKGVGMFDFETIPSVMIEGIQWSGNNVPQHLPISLDVMFYDEHDRYITLITNNATYVVISGTCVNILMNQDVNRFVVYKWGEFRNSGEYEEIVKERWWLNNRERFICSAKTEVLYDGSFTSEPKKTLIDGSLYSVSHDYIMLFPGQYIKTTDSSIYKTRVEFLKKIINNPPAKANLPVDAFSHQIAYVDKNDAKVHLLTPAYVDNNVKDVSTSATETITDDKLYYDNLYPNYGYIMGSPNGLYKSLNIQDGNYILDGILEYVKPINSSDETLVESKMLPGIRAIYDDTLLFVKITGNVTVPSNSKLTSQTGFKYKNIYVDVYSNNVNITSATFETGERFGGNNSFPFSVNVLKRILDNNIPNEIRIYTRGTYTSDIRSVKCKRYCTPFQITYDASTTTTIDTNNRRLEFDELEDNPRPNTPTVL